MIILQCFSGLAGLFLFSVGLSVWYTVFFKRQTLIEGHRQASLAITTGIAVVMGSFITYVGFWLLLSAIR